MMRRTCGIAVALLLLTGAAPVWSEQRSLKAVIPEENTRNSVCVPVREVQIQKGDTLSGLSRKYSGRGSYYPQILLLNDIRNPDRIFTGDTIKLPLTPGNASKHKKQAGKPALHRAAEGSGSDQGRADSARVTGPGAIDGIAVPAKQTNAKNKPATTVNAEAGKSLFERAVKAYRQDDCRTALELFDRFLAENPASALAADADLYKAECYLKQSNQ